MLDAMGRSLRVFTPFPCPAHQTLGDVDVRDPQPDGARKLKPDAPPLWRSSELRRSAYTAESDEQAMDSQLI